MIINILYDLEETNDGSFFIVKTLNQTKTIHIYEREHQRREQQERPPRVEQQEGM